MEIYNYHISKLVGLLVYSNIDNKNFKNSIID